MIRIVKHCTSEHHTCMTVCMLCFLILNTPKNDVLDAHVQAVCARPSPTKNAPVIIASQCSPMLIII